MESRHSILYISSVPAEPGAGGSLVLHRHLQEARKRFDVEILSPPVRKSSFWGILRLATSVCARWVNTLLAEDVYAWIDGRWADRWLSQKLQGRKQAVVVTVAHGDLASAAARVARGAGLPLVVIFHDWWPDIPSLTKFGQRQEQAKFLWLHQHATASLPVSEGMQLALGSHHTSPLLYPIPSVDGGALALPLPLRSNESQFLALYAGNLSEYGPMVSKILQESLCHPGIRIEVGGARPQWSADFQDAMRKGGLWRDFLPSHELEEWFRSADAFLVPMVFDPAFRRRMETSFPSKLTEFSRYGKPLVVWGPEYSSAVRWAQQTNGAICVTSPCPTELITALEDLARNKDLCRMMGARARHAYETSFNPVLLQEVFESAVLASAFPNRGSGASQPGLIKADIS